TTMVAWSLNPATGVATIDNATLKGLATGVAKGQAAVIATSGAVMGQTTLTVTDATLTAISVAPATATIAKGTTQQFTATGTYSDMSVQDLTSTVSWTSDATAVATVSNAAGAKGLASG